MHPLLSATTTDLTTALGLSSFGVMAIAGLVIDLLISKAVFDDAERRRAKQEPVVLFAPWLWAVLVFFSSAIAGAAFYWTVHYSKLRSEA
jgi:hypothetical protein